MDKFEDWRDTPFFLVTEKAYHVTSTSTFSPLQFIKSNEPRTSRDFHDWIAMNESTLNPVNRNQLQLMCSQLSQNAYSVDQQNPPIKILLEVLGCWEGPMLVLNKLDSLRSQANSIGTRRLDEIVASDDKAIKFMEKIGRLKRIDITCTEFMSICTSYLNSLFGNPAEKPPYTLAIS